MKFIKLFFLKVLRIIFKNHNRLNSKIKGYAGALKDKKDRRDYSVGSIGVELPEEVSLKEYVVEVKGQGSQNSCVAHAICSAIELQLNMKDPKRFMPLSERYSYYYGRKASNLFPQDKGMYLRDAIKSAKKDGVAPEYLCKYNNSDINKEPSHIAWSIAQVYGASIRLYYRAFSSVNIKEQLAISLPVIIAVPIYDYWINNKSGNIRLPKSTDKKIGYHAILVVRYFENYFHCLNSWYEGWGNKGFFNIPMNYPRTDSWVIEMEQ